MNCASACHKHIPDGIALQEVTVSSKSPTSNAIHNNTTTDSKTDSVGELKKVLLLNTYRFCERTNLSLYHEHGELAVHPEAKVRKKSTSSPNTTPAMTVRLK